MHKKRFTTILLVITLILLIPLVAMQISDEVNWTLLDFIAAGTLLLCAGVIIEIAIRKIENIKYRIAIIIVFLFFFLLIWIELAVGIIGV